MRFTIIIILLMALIFLGIYSNQNIILDKLEKNKTAKKLIEKILPNYYNQQKKNTNNSNIISQKTNQPTLIKQEKSDITSQKTLNIKNEIEKEVNEEYPLPYFKPIEELTQNWKKIPSSAFPLEITTNSPITIKNNETTETLPAGNQLFITKQNEKGLLYLSKEKNSQPISIIDIKLTNAKEILKNKYSEVIQKKQNPIIIKRNEEVKKRLTAYQNEKLNKKTDLDNSNNIINKQKTSTLNALINNSTKLINNSIKIDGEFVNDPFTDPRLKEVIKIINERKIDRINIVNILDWYWSEEDKFKNETYQVATITINDESIFGSMQNIVKIYLKDNIVRFWKNETTNKIGKIKSI